MNKKIVSLGLATVMAVSLAAPVAAADMDDLARGLITTTQTAPLRYAHQITVNGTPLDLSQIPAGDGIPLRAIAEADYGSAGWYPDENMSQFYFGSMNSVRVSFADNSVTVNDEPIESKAVVVDGVTFVPAAALELLDGNYKAVLDEETNTYNITSRNGEPMMKLARSISTAMEMPHLMAIKPSEMEEAYSIMADNFTEVAGFFPMMIGAQCVVVGKLADGKEAAAKEQFEAYRKAQMVSFEHYMMQNLVILKNAKCVVNDGYIMFVVGGQYEDPDFVEPDFPENPITTEVAEKIFADFVAAQKEAE